MLASIFKTTLCRISVGLLTLVCTIAPEGVAQDDLSSRLDGFLREGKLRDAEEYFGGAVRKSELDHRARTALGITQFLRAIEELGQANFRYGLVSHRAALIPLARLPIPRNAKPERLSYKSLRQIIEKLNASLAKAEASLAVADTSDVLLTLYLGRAKLDLDGNQEFSEDETLWRIFAKINRAVNPDQGEAFAIGFDGADVHWLRGYCHVLMAICDFVLAHDESNLFARCGQLLFPNIESPFQNSLLASNPIPDESQWFYDAPSILDFIAAIHLLHFPVIDRERLGKSHRHLLQMIAQSRLCWLRAEAETDNNREWLPNPRQDSVMQLRVPAEVITGWHEVLDEMEAILQGKKLIPYWREYHRSWTGGSAVPERGLGINLKKFFSEPQDFDLILTMQGTNMELYLEEGSLSTPMAWSRMTGVFRGQFFGFAVWFN